MSSSVVTRFPPSPTGFLHIGGARTALFNWAFAKHHGGIMLLRIEDTDRGRSTKQAVDAIFEGLEWLGLDWSGEPVFQHRRAGRHVEIAEQLLREGAAYRCTCAPGDIEAMRQRARAAGRPQHYDGTCRNRPQSAAAGPYVVRFKAPQTGETVICDRVQGDVAIANEQLDDLVILRSDATPTYMLSVVVDDHDMGITHVIRGDDHMTNTARQILIYRALGWALPVFAHIPLIHGPDGAKLSKRHGALSLTAYRDMGFVPEAMRNYLARLGWSHGDDEIFSTEQFVRWFDLDGVGRSPARFDMARLENLNAHYLRCMDDRELLERLAAHLPVTDFATGWPSRLSLDLKQRLVAAMPALKERAKTLSDLARTLEFVFASRPLKLDDKAQTLLTADARAMLGETADKLERIEVWERAAIEAALRDLAAASGLKLGRIAQPLRAALTGTTVSPGIFDVLYILQRDEAIARIRDQTTA